MASENKDSNSDAAWDALTKAIHQLDQKTEEEEEDDPGRIRSRNIETACRLVSGFKAKGCTRVPLVGTELDGSIELTWSNRDTGSQLRLVVDGGEPIRLTRDIAFRNLQFELFSDEEKVVGACLRHLADVFLDWPALIDRIRGLETAQIEDDEGQDCRTEGIKLVVDCLVSLLQTSLPKQLPLPYMCSTYLGSIILQWVNDFTNSSFVCSVLVEGDSADPAVSLITRRARESCPSHYLHLTRGNREQAETVTALISKQLALVFPSLYQ